MSKHATLYQQTYGGGWYTMLLEDGTRVKDLDPYNPMELSGVHMHLCNVQYLWVYPYVPFSRIELRDIAENIDSDLFDWYHPDTMPYNGHPYCLRLRRKEKGHINRYIIWPGNMEIASPRNGDKGQWSLPLPASLNKTVDIIENELAMPFVWTCGKMGENVLRRTHEPARGRTVIRPFLKSQAAWFDSLQRGMMDRLIWRTYILDRLQGKHIVGIDKNGQYTGASFVRVGNGGFREAHSRELNEKACGFWQYRIVDVDGCFFDGRTAPCPLDVKREWASTDLIYAAYNHGVKLDIIKGIVWDENGRYLEKFASEMWAHRSHMREACEKTGDIEYRNAEGTFKAMSNAMVGRYMNEYAREYYHPDWNWMIVHKAIANMAYTLNRLNRDYGIVPILVNKDAMYWLSDEPTVPFDLHERELRGYKLIGACEMDESIADMLQSKRGINDIEVFIKGKMQCVSQEIAH